MASRVPTYLTDLLFFNGFRLLKRHLTIVTVIFIVGVTQILSDAVCVCGNQIAGEYSLLWKQHDEQNLNLQTFWAILLKVNRKCHALINVCPPFCFVFQVTSQTPTRSM